MNEALDDPQKHHKSRRLRSDAQESRDRGGRTLVHIRSPKLERDRGDFKAQTDEEEEDPKKQGDHIDRFGFDSKLDQGKVGLPRETKNPSDPINKKARAQSAKNQILHPSL